MIWAILLLLGVPLWLCAAGIASIVWRNRRLRRRYGDIPLRVRTAPDKRWTRGHAVWAHDVLAFRGSPSAWKEELFATTAISLREPSDDERKHLHTLGEGPVIARVQLDDDEVVEAAVAGARRADLLGPYELRAS